jgi:hypothetical protein
MRRALATALASESHHAIVLRCTLFLLLLHGASSPGLQVPVVVIAGICLILPGVVAHPMLWAALALGIALDAGRHWYAVDNHKYLIMYWVLACTLSLHQITPAAYLQTTARLLVGLVFACATAWKIIGGEYVNGSFLYATFLTDGRLQPLASAVMRAPFEDVSVISQAVGYLGAAGLMGVELTVPLSSSLQRFTLGLAWLTLLVEGGVAILHLVGARSLYVARHVSLMLFIIGTYFLFPVLGFAFVLTVMGLAQCDETDDGARVRYLIILGVIQLTMIPWRSLLVSG